MNSIANAAECVLEHNHIVVLLEPPSPGGQPRLPLYVALYHLDGELVFGLTQQPQLAARLNRERAELFYQQIHESSMILEQMAVVELLPGGMSVVKSS